MVKKGFWKVLLALSVSCMAFASCGGADDDKSSGDGGGDGVLQYTRVDENGVENDNGSYVLFGSYPQTEVVETTLIATLNEEAGDLPSNGSNAAWTSYKYYAGNTNFNSQSNANDYMWYQDITHEGVEYRGVYFNAWRPTSTIDSNSSTFATEQDDNGYVSSTVYWFEYEPILWQIVNETDEKATIVAKILLDSQEYNYTSFPQTVGENTIKACVYGYSSIRTWLNESFYQTAFDELQREIIQKITVDNSASTTASEENENACENTQDKIWLLSYKEATTYFADDAARCKKATDYAKCQGVKVDADSGNSYWWLRSPSAGSLTLTVESDGTASTSGAIVFETDHGVCPAMQIKL